MFLVSETGDATGCDEVTEKSQHRCESPCRGLSRCKLLAILCPVPLGDEAKTRGTRGTLLVGVEAEMTQMRCGGCDRQDGQGEDGFSKFKRLIHFLIPKILSKRLLRHDLTHFFGCSHVPDDMAAGRVPWPCRCWCWKW